ncbi:hypothetical protein QJQ45_020899 [Haematococcus lacustris]|nr:hypothetical protein QJQ45_020899 [Haematococcus lacustris]
MASLTDQIGKVQERIKEAEDRITFLQALPVRDKYESVCLEQTEKRLILFRKEEELLIKKDSGSCKLMSKMEASIRLILELKERQMKTMELLEERIAQLQACDG